MPFISVRDIQIYYEISGKGPQLLYISGTGADLRNKPNVFDSPLAEHFEILAFDQRGLGQTDRPDIRYSMEGYANDAAGLLKALDWGRCHVVGISFGGMVAQELALRHPDCVDRMVLCCTSSGGAGGHSYPFHEMPELPEDEMNSISVAINDSRLDAAWQQQTLNVTRQSWPGAMPATRVPANPVGKPVPGASSRHVSTTIPSIACPNSSCRFLSPGAFTTVSRRPPTLKPSIARSSNQKYSFSREDTNSTITTR